MCVSSLRGFGRPHGRPFRMHSLGFDRGRRETSARAGRRRHSNAIQERIASSRKVRAASADIKPTVVVPAVRASPNYRVRELGA